MNVGSNSGGGGGGVGGGDFFSGSMQLWANQTLGCTTLGIAAGAIQSFLGRGGGVPAPLLCYWMGRMEMPVGAKADAASLGRVRRPVVKGRGGLAQGVNPLSNKALLEALDDDA